MDASLERDAWQSSSSKYRQVTVDMDKTRSPAVSAGTFVAPPARTSPSVQSDVRCPQLNRADNFDALSDSQPVSRSSNVVEASAQLSTQVSNKFTDNFQRGTTLSLVCSHRTLYLYSGIIVGLFDHVTRPNGLHYGSCPSVCLSVRLPVRHRNSKTKRRREAQIGENVPQGMRNPCASYLFTSCHC